MRIADIPLYSEIKECYIDYRKKGVRRDHVVVKLLEEYHDEVTLGADDDGIIFWIGIADGQYQLKELTLEVAQHAQNAIVRLESSDFGVSSCDLNRRKEHYAAAPMPEKHSFRKTRKFQCTWKIGDVFAYPLSGDDANTYGLSGQYALFRKVGENKTQDGRVLPVCTLTIWTDETLPESENDFVRHSPLRLGCGRLGNPKNLYEYRFEMQFTRQNQVSSQPFAYLGNYPNVTMPDDEIIIDNSTFVLMMNPHQIEKEVCLYWKWYNNYGRG
jgi:hypothetical protein